MDGSLIELGYCLLFGIFILGLFVLDHKRSKERHRNIRSYLEKKNAIDIEIEQQWLDWDRDTSTYQVRYTDEEGKRHHTMCKIRERLFVSESKIYWEHLP